MPETELELSIEKLVADHLAVVRGYLAALGAAPDLIDDLSQDVFLAAIRNRETYDHARPLRSWLLGIARNLMRQQCRRAKAEAAVRSRVVTTFLVEQPAADAAEPLSSSRAAEALRACVGKLPERTREMVRLRFDEQQSSEAIAKVFGTKDSAVRMTLLRAREFLRRCIFRQLEAGEFAHEP